MMHSSMALDGPRRMCAKFVTGVVIVISNGLREGASALFDEARGPVPAARNSRNGEDVAAAGWTGCDGACGPAACTAVEKDTMAAQERSSRWGRMEGLLFLSDAATLGHRPRVTYE